MNHKRYLVIFVAAAALITACAGKAIPPSFAPGASASITVTSSAFQEGAPIPQKYSCDGENVNPAIHWSGTPGSAKSLALIVEDPDAPGGTFYHWVVYNLPPGTTEITEGLPKDDKTFTQGKSSFQQAGYGGPCPPKGSPHHYRFKVYALDLDPALPAGLNAKGLQQAIDGHVLAQGQLMGTYQR
jgi:Raf kinase inhibitor-like YbhB/YbcL family protein